MRKRVLARAFFERPTLAVARGLLGKYLVRRYRGKTRSLMITEVEAYDGPHDMASHASRGMTPRNRPLFGPAGHFYVYFTYGMHWLANIVTGPRGYPAAVLLRAGVFESPLTRSPRTHAMRHVNGPARLTKSLKIGRKENGAFALKRNGLWFEDRGHAVPRTAITAQKRIGVDYAGPVWAKKRYNFYLSTSSLSPSLSRASRRNTRTR